jgi:hypothetical protein
MDKLVPASLCAVCGMHDARALVDVVLAGGMRVTLCGSHELMHKRAGKRARNIAELKASFGERRGTRRRSGREIGEVDELAERLASAFAPERRVGERRCQ